MAGVCCLFFLYSFDGDFEVVKEGDELSIFQLK